jgi:hypothetical protein
MDKQIRCDFCHKFSDTKDVIRFYPYNFIHIDKHSCLFKHLRKLDSEKVSDCFNGFSDAQRFALAKKL